MVKSPFVKWSHLGSEFHYRRWYYNNKKFWEEPMAQQSVLASGAVGIRDHIFALSKTFMCFEMGSSL
jgi:hypothetical protein